MSELLAHLVGDYLLQSDWMAQQKTQRHLPAVAHAATYTLPFLALTRRWQPLLVIGASHFVIDRWRLAKHVVWAKNQAAPRGWRHAWGDHVDRTGYHRPYLDLINDATKRPDPVLALAPEPPEQEIDGERLVEIGDHCRQQEKPDWMAVWLLIVADNCLHGLANR